MRPLRIVALDLSTAATALAQTHDSYGNPRLSVATIPGTAGRPLHQQIDMIEPVVRKACGFGSGNARLGGVVDLVVCEGTFSREGASDYPLHALHANIKQWMHRRHIPYVDVAPSTVKLWATGSGATSGENKVTKDKVVAAVLATYGHLLNINPRDDNQSDGVALLSMGLAAYGQDLAPPPKERCRLALKTVTWPELGGAS